MEYLIVSLVALFAILILGGLLLGPSKRRGTDTLLEPPAQGDRRQTQAPTRERRDLDSAGQTQTLDREAPPAEPDDFVIGERPRLRDRLGKARGMFGGYFGGIRSRDKIDNETWDDLEEALIRADVGVATTTALLDDLRSRVKSESIKTPAALLDALKTDLKKEMIQADRTLRLEPGVTNVWLFVGVNGVGKTTTIGKVGLRYGQQDKSIVMAAGDTFRAAAAEQLTIWSERAKADIVRGQENGDPGSVIFDAIARGVARKSDLVLADTAGRLHTKFNLMEELKKIRRIIDKSEAQLSEVLLVLDATTGQNGLAQAKQFSDAVDCTGVVLTKLDGTAKGGIALAIEKEFGLPVKLVGVGETAADLIDFDPDEFVDALFEQSSGQPSEQAGGQSDGQASNQARSN